MSFIRREFYTKNMEIQRYLDRLMKDYVVILPPRVAMDLGRNKTIRKIRELDRVDPLIFIGHDRKFGVSIMRIREPIKIVKKGDKYVFAL